MACAEVVLERDCSIESETLWYCCLLYQPDWMARDVGSFESDSLSGWIKFLIEKLIDSIILVFWFGFLVGKFCKRIKLGSGIPRYTWFDRCQNQRVFYLLNWNSVMDTDKCQISVNVVWIFRLKIYWASDCRPPCQSDYYYFDGSNKMYGEGREREKKRDTRNCVMCQFWVAHFIELDGFSTILTQITFATA